MLRFTASTTAGRGSFRCRIFTPCSRARKSGRCSRSAPTRESARSCGARSPAAALPVRAERRPVGQHATPLRTCSTPRSRAIAPIIDAVAAIAEGRGVTRAQVALAWLRRNPVIVAPLVGATKPSHLSDAVTSLEITLTDDEVAACEGPHRAAAVFPGRLRRRRSGSRFWPSSASAGRPLLIGWVRASARPGSEVRMTSSTRFVGEDAQGALRCMPLPPRRTPW